MTSVDRIVLIYLYLHGCSILVATADDFKNGACYEDCIDGRQIMVSCGRILEGFLQRYPQVTVEKCKAICQDKGFTFAGLEQGAWCGCGNEVPAGHEKPGECNMACNGDSGQFCGDTSRINIYRTSTIAVKPTVESSADYADAYRGSLLLDDGCEGKNPSNYWLSPHKKTGEEAYIILNLGKITQFNTFKIKNTHNGHSNDRGAKKVSLYTSNSKNGPWKLRADKLITDARNKGCNVPLEEVTIATTDAQFIKLVIDSYYGVGGGGLKYLGVDLVPGCEEKDKALTDLRSDQSIGVMKSNGFKFDFTAPNADNNFVGQHCVANGEKAAWFGWSGGNNAVGTLSATFTGYGEVTVDFGNCWTAGNVKLYLDSKLISTAPFGMKSQKATFAYTPGSVLELKDENGNAVVMLNSISVNCNGKIWGEWSDWSEVTECTRRCKGSQGEVGKQRLTRTRSCSSAEGCEGESEFTERECYTQDCQCTILTNQQTGQQTEKVASFCSKFPKEITYREKEDFCKLSKTEKLSALLCTQMTPADAEALLNVAYEDHKPRNCKYDPPQVFDGDCGQLLQDKLSKSCSNADCKSKQSQVQEKIDKVIEETDKLYRQKIEEINIMATLTNIQLELNTFATKIKDYGEKQKTTEFRKKVEEFMGDVDAKLKTKANMGEDEKKKVKDKASKLFRQNAVESINTDDATKELNRLKEKENSMKGASKAIKKQYNRLKENIRGMSSAVKVEKAGKAVGNVLSSITKFKQGDAMNVIGGVLDIATGISQFLPPTISIITETISSIFSIFSGKSGPTTESVIKDEFKKQKEWMEKKFDEVDKRFDGLQDGIKNNFEKLDEKLDKSFDDLKTAIESITMKLTESQKDLLLLKGLTDQKRYALGLWHELELKLAFIIDNEGNDHTVPALNLIVQHMNFFNDESAKFKFRDFVETECKNQKSTGLREHCLVLAYAALMIERTDEIILTRTMALLAKSGPLSSIDYTSLLKTRKEIALKFLQDIFTSTDENEYSYISCGLSENSNAKLTDEQKKTLYDYAAHLNPTGLLKKNMKEREKCVDAMEPLWKTYDSKSSPGRNAELNDKLDDCCKKGSALEIMTCSAPKNGGVDCPSSSRCHGYIRLRYCPGVKSNEMIPGTVLLGGDTLTSPNGKYKLVMQTDGNLVFYSIRNGKPYWDTKTNKDCPGANFLFQTDGNMVIYNREGGVCWESDMGGQRAGKLTITDDLDLKLTHKTFDTVIWKMRDLGLHHRETGGFTLDGGGWGTWGSGEKCPFPHFVSKMELKIEDKLIYRSYRYPIYTRGDNTALNNIRLTCSDGTTLTSKAVGWGNWKGIKQCNSGSYINQARIRKENYQGNKDDSAANGIKFKCDGSNAQLSPGDGWFGDWQQWHACPSGSAIVGLRTMDEKYQGDDDDTALNKVEFFCALLL